MTGSIDDNFYCGCVSTCPHGYSSNDICKYNCDRCTLKRRKYPTPEQFKEEYGVEYPDSGAVYYYTDKWKIDWYKFAKYVYPENVVVCACTPWGKPPADWRPE